VQHNMQAANANRMLNVTTGQQAKSTEKLSSGYRINRAADDAAGLTISEKMRKQIKGLDRASTNAEDGVSSVQTAEGALTEVHSMLQRMNELANQASNGTNSKSDRDAIQAEIDQLNTEIDRVSETTKFNETYLLKGDGGSKAGTLKAHDAGLKGKLTDNGDTATFEIELKEGNTVSIAGKEYTISDTTDEDKQLLSKDDAAAKIQAALKQANDIGATNDAKSAVTFDVQKKEILGINDPTATFKAKGAMVAYDKTNKTFQNIKDGDDITELVKNADITLYKNAQNTASTTADGKAKTNLLVVHEDNLAHGVAQQINKGAAIAAGANGIDTVNGGTATAAANHKIYEEINLAADTTTNASYEASAKLSDGTNTKASFDITFEKLGTDTATAEKIAEGQNALKAAMGQIKYTYGANDGAFSHDFAAGSKLDIDHDGKVSYDGVKIATITATGAAQTAGTDTLAVDGDFVNAVAATKDASDKYTFNITKGTTAGAKDLSFNLHVGADADMTNKINVTIEAMDTENLGIKGLNVSDDSGIAATYAIDAIQDAIEKVSSQRSALGAVQNRLEHTISNLDNVVENTTAAESRIRDTDMASEMVNYSKNNILAQAGQSMLAQANQSNQGVLSLLQ
ncbi:flagellin N-terminal helical domain-containing protein, partial [Agathobacter sp.]|uniref:flagellin N-terminal helical domain-containing protein n=1 Tax=Agathobacter sp. TaxID=2021311 RepID=UPI003FD76A3A